MEARELLTAPPTISQSFGAASVLRTGTTGLNFTITNPSSNSVAETGTAFTDILPAGLTAVDGSSSVADGGTLTVSSANSIAAALNPSASSESLGVTFTASDGTISNEIPVISYSWGGTNASGTLTVNSFQLVVSPTTAEPYLWGMLDNDTRFPQVTLYARRTTSSGPFTYLTYTLKNAAVSSYQTASPGGAQDTIALSFGEIDETYTHQNADGSAGTSVTVSYNVTSDSGGASSVTAPVNSAASTEPLGVVFTTGGGTSNEIPVTSYSWGASRSLTRRIGENSLTVNNFQIVLSPDSAEPDLWGVLTTDTSFSAVTLYARRNTGSGPFTYLAYTLKNAVLNSYQTTSPGGMQDSITLSFGEIDETFTHENSDGSAGSSVTVTYNVTTGTVSGAVGSLSALQIPLLLRNRWEWFSPRVATRFRSYPIVGASRTRTLTVNSFQLVLSPDTAEPDLWGALADGLIIGQVSIYARNDSGSTPFQYLVYSLKNVVVSGFQTISPGGTDDTVSLNFSQIQETYTPENSDGTAGTPVTVSYNVEGSGGGTSSVLAPANPLASSEPLGAVFTTGGNEIPAVSYSWGANSTAGKATMSSFQLVLDPGSAEPDLWGVLASGALIAQVSIYARNDSASTPFQYLAFTLTNVVVAGFQTISPGGTDDTVSLNFSQIQETYTPENSDGTAGTPVTVSYNVDSSGGGASSVVAPANPLASSEPLGLTFTTSGGTSNEVPVTSYSWGGASGTTAPSLNNFQITLTPNSAEPDLWGLLASDSVITQVSLNARDSGSSGSV